MVAEERATPSGQDAGQHSEGERERGGRESVVKSETEPTPRHPDEGGKKNKKPQTEKEPEIRGRKNITRGERRRPRWCDLLKITTTGKSS